MGLVENVRDLLAASPKTSAILSLPPFDDFAPLAGALFTHLTGNPAIGKTVHRAYGADKNLIDLTIHDIAETARRNFEPGGAPTTLLFARGVHAVMAHRVAHSLWRAGDANHALAIKSTCGRVFGTDMHPAAQIGAGFWLDHGLGFVLGETSVIDDDVSIWHNVTLGSTLNDDGAFRHPHVGQGAVIGAGAILLGGIKIGSHANIAAGAIVVTDVADNALVVGPKAQVRGTARVNFTRSDQT